jgi:hypothetical protein
MSEHPVDQRLSTLLPDAAVAASREGSVSGGLTTPEEEHSDFIDWTTGVNLTRGDRLRPYRRKPGDPLYRPLRIYTLDPTQSKLEGAVVTLNVPYEELEPGPVGALLEVDSADQHGAPPDRQVDLNDSRTLLTQGVAPSPANRAFPPQMVYAVCSSVYSAFKVALGRDLTFGFLEDPSRKQDRLRLLPFGMEGKNARYESQSGVIRFGCFTSDSSRIAGRTAPNGKVYTAVSHDIIAHEFTHALMHGLRSTFNVPSNPDVLAFHEGFADLVAMLQHFAYPEVVLAGIRRSRGDLATRNFLTDMAMQFGQTTGSGQALRSLSDGRYSPDLEPHQLGQILTGAVFDTFTRIFWRKVERVVRLATNGTGVLPTVGDLPFDLQVVLAENASRVASQFLSICIRAIDYCPPVDITFGEFLRAVITADTDLVPSDPWAYREAWLDGFAGRGIFPEKVDQLTEDAVVWTPAVKDVGRIEELSFAHLRFSGDPAHPMPKREVRRQARVLGKVICSKSNLEAFGLTSPDNKDLGADRVGAPRIESIRASRRIGPSGQIAFDLIAEVVQSRLTTTPTGRPFHFHGGATLVIDPDGNVRYAIIKKVMSGDRLPRQASFVESDRMAKYWSLAPNGHLEPVSNALHLIHEERSREHARSL